MPVAVVSHSPPAVVSPERPIGFIGGGAILNRKEQAAEAPRVPEEGMALLPISSPRQERPAPVDAPGAAASTAYPGASLANP
jgi:hypothetical protein